MKKKSKKGYKLSEETKEKLKIQQELKKQEESILNQKELRKKEKKAKKKLKNKENKISFPKALETIFIMAYLGFLYVCIFKFFGLAKSNKIFLIYGCLTTILAFGDSFHLIPKFLDNMKKKGIKYKEFWFGLGSQISSITMTWFYLILFFICKKMFPEVSFGIGFDIALYIMVGIRILICLLPQNNWFSNERNMKLSVIRNLIFLIIGILEIILFSKIGNKCGLGLWKIAISIGLSFVFYLPVAFGGRKYPKLRILMIPKTVCYVWMIYMGLDLIGKV